MYEQANEALTHTRVRIMLAPNTAMISSLMLDTEFVWSTEIPTAETTGVRISINPDFFVSLSPQHQMFVVLHELWHDALLHPFRGKGKIAAIWQQAVDYVVNDILYQGKFQLLQGVYHDPRFRNMDTEAVYDILLQENQSEPNPCPAMGADIAPPDPNQSDKKQQAQATKAAQKVLKAADNAKMQVIPDTLPDELRKALDEMLNPELPWDMLLTKYLTAKAKTKVSWFKRNRRIRTPYLPSRYGQAMGNIDVFVDASGSITTEELTAEVQEMLYIKELVNPKEMTIQAFSHVLGEAQVFDRNTEIDFDVDVDGGTDLRPVWEVLKQREPEVAIIFTDGYVSVPPLSGVSSDIIFVIVNNKSFQPIDGVTILHMEI